MKKFRLPILLILACLVVSLLALSVSAAPENGWHRDGDVWYYYRDGSPVCDEVLTIGGVRYAFLWDGRMLDNYEWDWVDGDSYRAKPGGALMTNQWYEKYGEKYYYGADGKGYSDFQTVGGKEYFFTGYGMVAKDKAVYSHSKSGYYALSKDGTQFRVLNKNGWNEAFGQWYYIQNGDCLYTIILNLGANTYYFDHNGKMVSNGSYELYNYDTQQMEYHLFDANGVMLKNGWKKLGSDWYYVFADGTLARGGVFVISGKEYYFEYDGQMVSGCVYEYWDPTEEIHKLRLFDTSGVMARGKWVQLESGWYYAYPDGEVARDGLNEIGGKLYYFNGYEMYDLPGEFEYYYVTSSGELYRNRWYKDTTGYEYETGWAYYGSNGERCYGLNQIGGVWYYFGSYRIMVTNSVLQTEEGVFIFNKDGVGKKVDGWFTGPNGNWYYAKDGYFAHGPVAIGGATYCFMDGELVKNDFFYNHGVAYIANSEGKLISNVGWHKVDGRWYYVEDATGKLADGVKTIGGVCYYFEPWMVTNALRSNSETKTSYVINSSGVCTKLTGNGFVSVGYDVYYMENNKPVTGWKQISGKWYYFGEYGEMYSHGRCYVDGKYYFFAQDGVMQTNGWYFEGQGAFYVDANGVVATGLQTIGGKQYLFDDSGWKMSEGFYCIDDVNYLVGADGQVLAKLTKKGWNQVGSDWYYVNEDGMPATECLVRLDGVIYGFGRDGKMCKGGIQYAWYDYYIFDNSGRALTGWHKIDGKWYYAWEDSEDPCIIREGLAEIDGKEYIFYNCYMQIGTIILWDTIYTTDANGVVVNKADLPNGWTYANGTVRYIKNGNRSYTGWVGDYYVEDGAMLFDEILEYAGKIYYLRPDGRYLKNGSCSLNDYGSMVRAKADGTLYCNEWYQQGSNWYYYEYIYMACNGYYSIQNQTHRFDETGKWLGVEEDEPYKPENLKDGWHQISGKWYYYEAGRPYVGTRYVDGARYYFDYATGAMVTNSFDEWGDAYYGSNGKLAAYTGWKQLNGEWYYFGPNHTTVYGWLQSGGGWYFFDEIYDEEAECWRYPMITNQYRVCDGKLYYFGSNGYCTGAVTKDGWYEIPWGKCYVQNGRVLGEGFHKIGNDYYYMNWENAVKVNDYVYFSDGLTECARYFGADGKMITKSGWHETRDGWIYIDRNGFVYTDGIYKIGNNQYTFRGCLWVQ